MRSVLFGSTLLIGIGCAASPPAPDAKPGAAAQAAASTAAPSPSSLPAGMSEEAFIALHQHTEASAPPSRGEEVTVAGQRMYLSLPEGKTGPFPAVIVIHEWWGLNENVRHWTDRLAAEGYAALAVDLYRGVVATDRDTAMAAMKGVDDGEALVTLGAAVAYVKGDPRIQATKVASVGWCFGGGWSLRAALTQSMDASVIYYGRLITDAEALRSIRGDILGVFGNRDRGIPPEQVDAFEAALQQAGVRHRILRYDADHAFANPSSARYDRPSAEAAWGEVRAFFAAHLRG